MNIFGKALLIITITAQIIGYFLVAIAGSFLFRYLERAQEPGSNELLAGVALGVMYGFSALFIGCCGALMVKKQISPKSFQLLTVPAIFTSVLFVAAWYLGVSYAK